MARSRDDEFGGAPMPQLICGEEMLDVFEVTNGIILAEYISSLAGIWHEYRFTPELVQECNRLAMNGIYDCAGEYRRRCVTAGDFVGQSHREIPHLVEEMCAYTNSCTADPFHAAAYILWRTNWIHPFQDGNGRVSRELCYLALLVGLDNPDMGGEYPISALLKREEKRYMQALRAADVARYDDRPDVRHLESLLCELLAEQASQ